MRSRAVIPILLAAFLPACAVHNGETRGDRSGERVVTGDEVRASGATTAWEVMKRMIPGISFRDDRQGNPIRMSVRGASSIHLADRPNIFIDGVRVTDFTRLAQIPAGDIEMIRFLNGISATTLYGTNSGDGAILIHTKNGRPGS